MDNIVLGTSFHITRHQYSYYYSLVKDVFTWMLNTTFLVETDEANNLWHNSW